MAKNIWKSIPDFSRYEANQHGQIRNRKTKRVMAQHARKDGYIYTDVCDDHGSGSKKRYVHRLVAAAWVVQPKDKEGPFDVNHKNGLRHDNRPENLEWVTRAENIKHGYKHGRIGEARPEQFQPRMVRVTQEYTGEEIIFPSIGAAARFFNIPKTTFGKYLTKGSGPRTGSFLLEYHHKP